jgi:hypothetical protein
MFPGPCNRATAQSTGPPHVLVDASPLRMGVSRLKVMQMQTCGEDVETIQPKLETLASCSSTGTIDPVEV